MWYRNMCQGWEKRAIIQIVVLFSGQFHFPILNLCVTVYRRIK